MIVSDQSINLLKTILLKLVTSRDLLLITIFGKSVLTLAVAGIETQGHEPHQFSCSQGLRATTPKSS